MNVTQHQRPGVYSVYDASSALAANQGGKTAAVAAVSVQGEPGKPRLFTGYDQAAEAFGADSDLARAIDLLLQNGAAKVYAVPVAAESGYPDAFAALEGLEDVALVVCASTALATQQALRDSVKASSQSRRERIAVVPGGSAQTAAQLVERAAELNCERAVLIPGGLPEAAAFAGALAGEPDPAVPLGGAELRGVTALSESWNDNELDQLILGGVTPLEVSGGVVSVVRAVTTRTKTGSSPDATWRELTTVRIVDDVIPALRMALRAKFARPKNTPQGRQAIRSQVIVELEQKKADEIITGYDGVAVTPLEDNPTVCLVEFRFTVAHGLNQIWLSANITV